MENQVNMSRIPRAAKRVFKGKIFEVYHWRQKMFDGTSETFEMLKRPDSVQVIPVRSDKILIASQEQPGKPQFHSLLGGRADEGEEPLAAAKRELLEEAGYQSDDWELYKVYEPYSKIDWKIHYYLARNCRQVSKPKLDAGEKIKILELDFDTFVEIVTAEEFHGGEFACDLLRMRQDRRRLQEFRKKLQV